MWKVNDEICFNHELKLAKTQFETGHYDNAIIHLQNAIGSAEELKRVKNKQDYENELKGLLDEVAQRPDRIEIYKKLVQAYE